MGNNLKNVRRGKNASKIAKWFSLMLLIFKSKFIRHVEFSDNLDDLYGKCYSNNFFHILWNVQKVRIRSHSFMMEVSNLACFSHFWHLLSYSTASNFMNSRSRDGLAVKDLCLLLLASVFTGLFTSYFSLVSFYCKLISSGHNNLWQHKKAMNSLRVAHPPECCPVVFIEFYYLP